MSVTEHKQSSRRTFLGTDPSAQYEHPLPGLLMGWEKPKLHGWMKYTVNRLVPTGEGCRPKYYEGDGHLLTVAPTGAGKGTGCLIPALLTHQGSVIVVDPKGENYAVTARYRRSIGQAVIAIDPFGLTGGKASSLNPMGLIRSGAHRVDDATMLADLIANVPPGLKDPFWTEMGRAVIKGLLLYLDSQAGSATATVPDLRNLLLQNPVDFDTTLNSMRRYTGACREASKVANLLLQAEPRVRASILSTAQQQVEFMAGGAASSSLADGGLDLAGVIEGRQLSIFLILPVEKLNSHANLLRLWIGSLLIAVMRRRRPPLTRTLFLLDEVAQLGNLALLAKSLTLLRANGLQIWTFWQDMGQLKRLYPEEWETIVNNAGVLQFFGISTGMMGQQISEIIGWPPERICAMAGGTGSSENLLLLPTAELDVKVLRRPDYRRDALFARRADPNPYHEF